MIAHTFCQILKLPIGCGDGINDYKQWFVRRLRDAAWVPALRGENEGESGDGEGESRRNPKSNKMSCLRYVLFT